MFLNLNSRESLEKRPIIKVKHDNPTTLRAQRRPVRRGHTVRGNALEMEALRPSSPEAGAVACRLPADLERPGVHDGVVVEQAVERA